MTFQFQIDSKLLTIKLENRKNIKHCYLRVLSKDLVQIRANVYFSEEDAKKLLRKKKTWILASIEKINKNVLDDKEFLFLGQKKLKTEFFHGNIDIFYRNKVEEMIPPLIEKYSKIMELYPSSIKYRKNKRTWGSCNYKNALNFNTLLVKFPIEVMEYVVIHELAHIKHKNHSKEFWSLVFKYCPDYKKREELLKSFL